MKWILVVLLILFPVVAQAAVVESGVDVTSTITPTSGTGSQTVSRTVTLTNSNLSATSSLNFNVVYHPATGNATTFALSFSWTVSGARLGRVLDMAVPASGTFVPGSLKINGVAQANPASFPYSLTLDLPAATNSTTPSVMTVTDQVTLVPPA